MCRKAFNLLLSFKKRPIKTPFDGLHILLYLLGAFLSLYMDGETMIQSRLYYARGLRLYGTHICII